MEVMNRTGIGDFLVKQAEAGKLFFGMSAGSIMMAEEWVRWIDPDDDATAELFPCLGLAPVICDTHAEEDDWVELKAALMLEKNGTGGYGIPSGGCIKISPDGKIESLGGPVARYVHRGDSVEKLPDMKPGK